MEKMQLRAKKLFIGFLIMMILLTIVSRAADSVTVAKVDAVTPSGGELVFEVMGKASVESDGKSFVYGYPDLHVEKILVDEGTEVFKGDSLIQLNASDVEKLKVEFENTKKNLNIQLAEAKLEDMDTNVYTVDEAKTLWDEAKEDENDAMEDYKKTKKEYQNELVKVKNKAKEDNESTLKRAKMVYDNVKLTCENGLTDAKTNWDNSLDELTELTKKEDSFKHYLEQYVECYKKYDYTTKELIIKAFVELKLGDNYESYEEDLKEKKEYYEDLESNLRTLKTTLGNEVNLAKTAMDNAKKQLDQISASDPNYDSCKVAYDTAKSNYEDKLKTYDSSVKGVEQNVDAAYASYSSARTKERSLQSTLDSYSQAVINNNSTQKENHLLQIRKYVYGSNGYDSYLKQITLAEKKISEKEREYNLVVSNNEITLNDAKETYNEVLKKYKQIKNDTYDFQDEINAQKSLLDSAEKNYDLAKRTTKKAKLNYDKTLKMGEKDSNSLIVKGEKKNFQIEILTDEINDTEEKIEDMKELIKNEYSIISEYDGTVKSISAIEGSKTSESELLSINNHMLELQASILKEEGEFISVGDKVEVSLKGSTDKIKTQVESRTIDFDENGLQVIKITALLPDTDLKADMVVDFKISKTSDRYEMCLPMSSIKEDMLSGYYVFVIKEKDTVLGKQLVVQKEKIEITDKDGTNAGITGNIGSDDEVIVSSNKVVREGDRVRLK